MKSLNTYIAESESKSKTKKYNVEQFLHLEQYDNLLISDIPIKSLTEIDGLSQLSGQDIGVPIQLIIEKTKIRDLTGCCKRVRSLRLYDIPTFKSFKGDLKQATSIILEDIPITNYDGLTELHSAGPKPKTFEHIAKDTKLTKYDFTNLNAVTSTLTLNGLGFDKLTNLHVNLNASLNLSNLPCFTSAHNIWKHVESAAQLIIVSNVNIHTSVLGILRIKELRTFMRLSISQPDQKRIYDIIAKYIPLKSMSDIMRCKQELTDAGFKEAAQF